jgi:hypothetical protein
VFLGKYHFKGLVSNYIFNNIKGTGTQQQQYFGNITSNSYLETIYNQLQLQNHIRICPTQNPNSLKHIFVYALLGYITQQSNEQIIEHIIYKYFIEPTSHLLPHTNYITDPWQKLIFICKQNNIAKPIRHIHTLNNQFECTITINNTQISNSSVSYTYCNKKTSKQALKHLVQILNTQLNNNPKHIALHNQIAQNKIVEKQKEKVKKQEELKQKQAEKAAKKQQEKLAKQQKAEKLLQQKRKLRAEKKAKNTTTKQSIYREYTAEEISKLSIAKRRNLQDRGII